MIQCQNCGQINNYESNFCRFCGTKMVMASEPRSQLAAPFETQPPRPYIWKTDEFQMPENGGNKMCQINQVQPIADFRPPNQSPLMHSQNRQQPQTFQQPAPLVNYGYRCPQCGTQNFPHVARKISTAGWIVFAVLLVMFFPLFWIGLLIKEDIKTCPVCGIKVG